MAHAYTPGLRVTESTVLRRERRLPLKGEVLAKIGQTVRATDIVARTLLPGNVQTVNVANSLGADPMEVSELLVKKVGEEIGAGEPLGRRKGFFGLFNAECKSPASGTVEAVSEVTGQVIVREPPMPVEIDAYLDGKISEVIEGEGVVVEARGAFVQGIFGIGGETYGELITAVASPDLELTSADLKPEFAGKVVVGGSYVSHDVLREAIKLRIAAVIVGGFDDQDLRDILGYDLGVAITGTEEIGITLMLTEGFGRMPMAERTFKLLEGHTGRLGSVSGATQIRAGVMRPEVIIPHPEEAISGGAEGESSGLELGTLLRGIREPYFGRIGKVTALPPELEQLESEAKVRVLEAEFDGERVIIPRANVELIES
jgi:hypothetical protein